MFGPWLEALVRPDDMVMGFGPPEGDAEVDRGARRAAAARGHDLRAARAPRAPTPSASTDPDPFVHQELIEILYHTLWETVHVFFEHRELGHDVGQAGFLYPFLGRDKQAPARSRGPGGVVHPHEGGRRRARSAPRSRARGRGDRRGHAAPSHDRLAARRQAHPVRQRRLGHRRQRLGDRLRRPAAGLRPLPAMSLSMEPANITAIANDVGTDVVFLRQLIAHARAGRRGGRHLDQRRLPQRHRGAGRGAEARAAHGGAAGLRRRRDPAAAALADHCIVVDSDYIPRIQEVQASIYHIDAREPGGARP